MKKIESKPCTIHLDKSMIKNSKKKVRTIKIINGAFHLKKG